jgi:hypothetical protein
MFGVEIWKVSNPEKPVTIVVKCYPVNESRQEFIEASNIFQVELGMYDEVIPALKKFQEILPESERILLPFAPMIFGQYIKPEDRLKLGRPLKPLDNSIVMPDLRKPENGPFVLRDRFLGFDVGHYRLAIEGQAKLHAVSWAYKCSRGLESLCTEFPYLKGSDEMMESFDSFMDSGMKTVEEMFHDRPDILKALAHLKRVCKPINRLYFGDAGPGQQVEGHTKDSIVREKGPIIENEEPWTTLLHGDCWSNNMMFRYDEKTGRPIEVVFIDLQMSREADPMSDICYALYTSGQPDLRRKHLTSMLHLYFDTFTEVCQKFGVPPFPGWSWEEFNRRFRRATILGGYMALGLHFILKNPDELENLDDAMEKVEISGERSGDVMQNMSDFFAGISKTKKLHPAVLPRITAVFEDLIKDGIL